MFRDTFKIRTKAFALAVVKLVEGLPADPIARTLGLQLLRSGTSVAANFRAAVRGRSSAEFIAKMGIVEEECDETLFWIELLVESGRITAPRAVPLLAEGHEILAITVASIKTARRGLPR